MAPGDRSWVTLSPTASTDLSTVVTTRPLWPTTGAPNERSPIRPSTQSRERDRRPGGPRRCRTSRPRRPSIRPGRGRVDCRRTCGTRLRHRGVRFDTGRDRAPARGPIPKGRIRGLVDRSVSPVKGPPPSKVHRSVPVSGPGHGEPRRWTPGRRCRRLPITGLGVTFPPRSRVHRIVPVCGPTTTEVAMGGVVHRHRPRLNRGGAAVPRSRATAARLPSGGWRRPRTHSGGCSSPLFSQPRGPEALHRSADRRGARAGGSNVAQTSFPRSIVHHPESGPGHRPTGRPGSRARVATRSPVGCTVTIRVDHGRLISGSPPATGAVIDSIGGDDDVAGSEDRPSFAGRHTGHREGEPGTEVEPPTADLSPQEIGPSSGRPRAMPAVGPRRRTYRAGPPDRRRQDERVGKGGRVERDHGSRARTRCPIRDVVTEQLRTTARWVTSSAAIGSSRRRRRAPVTNARARATRCDCPPERRRGTMMGDIGDAQPIEPVARQGRRRRSSTHRMAAWPEGHIRQRIEVGEEEVLLEDQPTRALFRGEPGRRVRGSSRTRPSRTIRPPVSGSTPASARSRVVLPAPFGPRTATTSPSATSRWTPRWNSVESNLDVGRQTHRRTAPSHRPRSATSTANEITNRSRDSATATRSLPSQRQVDGERKGLRTSLDVTGERDGGAELAEGPGPGQRRSGDQGRRDHRRRHQAERRPSVGSE